MRLSFIIFHFFWSSLGIVTAQDIAAFHSGKGPGVVFQEASTGDLFYNFYSAQEFNQFQKIIVTENPRNGTSLAANGYFDGENIIYISIFYQAEDFKIVQVLLKCAAEAGTCESVEEVNISSKVTTPVDPKTGLSSALFSEDAGYRVTYQDDQGQVRQLSYAKNTLGELTDWDDGKSVGDWTSASGKGLATTYTTSSKVGMENQTLYLSSDGGILPVTSQYYNSANWSTISDTTTWVENPRITDLPNWSPENATFSTFTYGNWTCFFYVDVKKQLQFIRSTDEGQTWDVQSQMDPIYWPLADEPNAHIAATRSTNTSDLSGFLYYKSGQKLIQARLSQYEWEESTVIEQGSLTLQSKSDKTVTTASTTAAPKSSLSTRNIKIGAAVAGGSVLLAIILVLSWSIYRKRSQPVPIKHEPLPPKVSDDFAFTVRQPKLSSDTEVKEVALDPESLPGFREVKELESGFERPNGYGNESSLAQEVIDYSILSPIPQASKMKSPVPEFRTWGRSLLRRSTTQQSVKKTEQNVSVTETPKKGKRIGLALGTTPLSPNTMQQRMDERAFSYWRDGQEDIHIAPLRIAKIGGESQPSTPGQGNHPFRIMVDVDMSPLGISRSATPVVGSELPSMHSPVHGTYRGDVSPMRCESLKEDIVSSLYPQPVQNGRRRARDCIDSPV